MLYPYHLSDIMVKGLRITPFSYYTGIMEVSLQVYSVCEPLRMGRDYMSGTPCRGGPALQLSTTVDIVSRFTV